MEFETTPYQVEILFNRSRWANNCTVTPLFYICCYGAFFIMITKEEVLNAFDIIEKYQEQERQKIKELEVESDKRSILILGLNTRELNCLRAANIKTIGELLSTDIFELRKFRNIGKGTIDGINRKLKDFGIETPDFRTW